MKTKNLFAMVIAGLAFCACSNDNEAVTPQSKEKANIVVDFSGIRTRAIETPVADASYAPVNNLNLFILDDSGKVLVADYLTGEDIEELNENPYQKVKTYEGVSTSADKVYAIANHGAKLTETTLATLQAKVYTIDSQNATSEAGNVLLSGLEDIDTTDLAGEDDERAVWSAEVTLVPEVARFQIMSIGLKDDADYEDDKVNTIESFKVGGIYLNKAYTEMTLGGVGSEALDEECKNTDANFDTYYIASNFGSLAIIEDNITIPADECAAFNFFASATTKINPHILVKLTDVTYAEGFDGKSELWITIKSFLGSDNKEFTDWKKGDIYTIDEILFDQRNTGDGPYEDNVDVRVTIKVAPWTEVNLKPGI